MLCYHDTYVIKIMLWYKLLFIQLAYKMLEHSLYIEGKHYIPSQFPQIKQYINKASVFSFRGEWMTPMEILLSST